MSHAREASPAECCGVLLGLGDEIVEAVRARNIADEPRTRFLIDPADHCAAIRTARARGLDVVGFYHSHPASPAEPSGRDRTECSYPGYLYAIVSLQTEPPEVRLFRAGGDLVPTRPAARRADRPGSLGARGPGWRRRR